MTSGPLSAVSDGEGNWGGRRSRQRCASDSSPETVRATAADLAGVVDRFPLPEAEVGRVVMILDRLSEECAEAAGMLRRSQQGVSELGHRV